MLAKDILKDLISFNTVNDQENKEIINYIEKYLTNIGFKTEYKSKCLVMSNKKDCDIAFLGHTDTVPASNDWIFNPYSLCERDNKLYGLGTSDMKGSIAAILSAVSKIKWDKVKTGIKLFFTYDEEIGFKGIKELIDNKERFPKLMIIGEPTNNEIVNASKGLLEFKFTFRGLASHSSKPDEGINAIENCLIFLNELKKFYYSLKKDIIATKYATMNIGVINGGRCINIVPDNCEVLVDFRTVTKEQNELIIKEVQKLIEDYDATYEIINNINPFISKSLKIVMSDFITEASFIETDNKYILGIGPNNAHKIDEFITIDSLRKLEEQYINIIKNNIRREDV